MTAMKGSEAVVKEKKIVGIEEGVVLEEKRSLRYSM